MNNISVPVGGKMPFEAFFLLQHRSPQFYKSPHISGAFFYANDKARTRATGARQAVALRMYLISAMLSVELVFSLCIERKIIGTAVARRQRLRH